MKVITKLTEYKEGHINPIPSNQIDSIPRTNTVIEIGGINYRVILTVLFDHWLRPKSVNHCSEHVLVTDDDYEKQVREKHFVLSCGVEHLEPINAIIEIDSLEKGGIGLCDVPVERFDYVCLDGKTVFVVMKIKIVSKTLHLKIEESGNLETLKNGPVHFGKMTNW